MHALITLPVELLYEIQLFATSHTFPQTCRALHQIFASSPPSYRAQYLVACTDAGSHAHHVALTRMLRYPICTQDVLEAYFRAQDPARGDGRDPRAGVPRLPKRLFRALVHPCRHRRQCSARGAALSSSSSPHLPMAVEGWSDRDPPLPFLRYLYARLRVCPPDANAHEGYALTKAVQAGFVPLVRFLLDRGATPAWKGNLAVIIAIHRRDLGLVRMLVEGMDAGTSPANHEASGKRQKLKDRVEVTPEMLRTAVKCRAHDVVEYLTKEKGCVPDMQTLLLMR